MYLTYSIFEDMYLQCTDPGRSTFSDELIHVGVLDIPHSPSLGATRRAGPGLIPHCAAVARGV